MTRPAQNKKINQDDSGSDSSHCYRESWEQYSIVTDVVEKRTMAAWKTRAVVRNGEAKDQRKYENKKRIEFEAMSVDEKLMHLFDLIQDR